jgi:chromosome segregation ATPase
MKRKNDNYSCARLCNAYNARAERDEKEIVELKRQIKELKKQIKELKEKRSEVK